MNPKIFDEAVTLVSTIAKGISSEGQYKEAQNKIAHVMDALPPTLAKKVVRKFRRLAKDERKEIRTKRHALEKEDRGLTTQVENARKSLDLTTLLTEWARAGLVLQRPTGSASHRFFEALFAGEVFIVLSADFMDPLSQNVKIPQMFVMEHNWAGAFEKAESITEGEFQLPYDELCFEFLISGRRVCVLICDDKLGIYVEVNKEWVVPQNMYNLNHGEWEPEKGENIPDIKDEFVDLRKLVIKQIRAVSIALEAEVATTDIIRAPYKLNHEREKSGKLPLFDYHVVKLAHRTRPVALPDDHVGGTRKRQRMHFVRGHWKHYTNHKTWTKWFLKGDPDLGFIDKEYRL